MLRGAEEALLRPTEISLNAAISACEKAAEWRMALALFDSMSLRCLEARRGPFGLRSQENRVEIEAFGLKLLRKSLEIG